MCIAGREVQWCIHWRTGYGHSSKVKCEITHLSLHPKELKKGPQKDIFIPMFISVIHSGSKAEASQVSTDTWVDKQNVENTHTHIMKHYSILKEILTHAIKWLTFDHIKLSEISHKKDKYYKIPLVWVS